jgi:rhamnosyltransferase
MWSNEQAGAPVQGGSGICVVLVTYHPDADFPMRLRRIAPQVDAILIVDNGSTDAELRMLRDAAADPKVDLTLNYENFGVARALNLGIRRVTARGYSLALLLDQDTCVDPDMVQSLLAIHAAFTERGRLAVIGSSFRDASGPVPGSNDPNTPDAPWETAESVITSGSLLPLAAYADIGPFREDFFIDYVDTEFCYRANAKGYRVIKSRKPLMSHTIGALSLHRFLWFKKWTHNHSPDRCYYIARNNTALLREYGKCRHSRIHWLLKSFNRCSRMCKRIALYEDTKALKIAAIVSGWRDGVAGNMGPRRPQHHSPARPLQSNPTPPPRHQGERA